MKSSPKPKQGKCKICRKPTTLRYGLTWACGTDHAYEASLKAKAENEARKITDERKELARRKEKIKPLSAWLREAQIAFNAYIRLRDIAEPCISCGRIHQGKWNAGHYRTVKAASQLRFDERNVHKQCEPCNSSLSGNIQQYRPRLAAKIGKSALDALENDNRIHKWTIEEAKSIKKEYAAKTRELIKQQNSLK